MTNSNTVNASLARLTPNGWAVADQPAPNFRRLRRPFGEVGQKFFGLASTSPNFATDRTWHHKYLIESDFDAIQLVYYNHQPNDVAATGMIGATETADQSTANNVSQPMISGAAVTTKDDTTDAYGWRTVTWAGSPNMLALAGTAAVPTITKSDWIPLASVPRTDGGIGRLLLTRMYITGSVTQHTTLTSGQIRAEMLTPTAANRGRIFQSGNVIADAITTPATTIAISTNALPLGVNVRMKGGGATVLGIGDSTMQCVSQLNDRLSNWGLRACADVSNENFPVMWVNDGQASVTSSAYSATGLTAIAAWEPAIVVWQASSQNDSATSAGVYRYQANQKLARMQAAASYCRDNGITMIAQTAIPKNFSAAIDAERLIFNAALRDMAADGHWWICDLDRALSDQATPARMRADVNSGDDTHPSEAGIEVEAQVLAAVLRRILERPAD